MDTPNLYKRTVFISPLLLFLFVALACTAPSSYSQVNVDDNGVALKGYDPVAYFTMGKPVKGDEQFGYDWNGARWLFASQEHKNFFMASPEKYAPQYGGY